MKMKPHNYEIAEKVNEMYISGCKFTEIAKSLDLPVEKVRYLYNHYRFMKVEMEIAKEFNGLDWVPAYGIYMDGIKTRKQLDALSDDVILYIINKWYRPIFDPEGNREDLLQKVQVFLGRKEAKTDAAE